MHFSQRILLLAPLATGLASAVDIKPDSAMHARTYQNDLTPSNGGLSEARAVSDTGVASVYEVQAAARSIPESVEYVVVQDKRGAITAARPLLSGHSDGESSGTSSSSDDDTTSNSDSGEDTSGSSSGSIVYPSTYKYTSTSSSSAAAPLPITGWHSTAAALTTLSAIFSFM